MPLITWSTVFCHPICCQVHKNRNIQNYDFSCCFIHVWHLVSYTLREEHGPNVRVGPRRKELTGEWIKLWWATLWFVILTRYSLGYEMGGMCSMCGREGTYILHDFGGDKWSRWCALVNVMNLPFLTNAENFLTSWATISFSIRALLHVVSQLCDLLSLCSVQWVTAGLTWMWKTYFIVYLGLCDTGVSNWDYVILKWVAGE